LFVHQDLTPKQREARKPLVAELKLRKANGEKDLTIFNGKIVQNRESASIKRNWCVFISMQEILLINLSSSRHGFMH